jgi:capsular polysaccharide transport system permease protein
VPERVTELPPVTRPAADAAPNAAEASKSPLADAKAAQVNATDEAETSRSTAADDSAPVSAMAKVAARHTDTVPGENAPDAASKSRSSVPDGAPVDDAPRPAPRPPRQPETASAEAGAREAAPTDAAAKPVPPKLRLVTPAADPVPVPEVDPKPAVAPVPALPILDKPVAPARRGKKKPQRKLNWGRLSFLLAVVVPTMIVGFYYAFLASPHYRSEMRFAVRGTERSTLETLGLSAMPGATTQAADAYIVIDYIHSKQVIRDIREKLGIDVRQFFAEPKIDFAYRIDPDMSLEEFIFYWRWMVDASFNSTTSITTFEVTAFSGEDAEAIAQAVLAVSGELVNDLSTKAREQLITTAQAEVTRTEDRLVVARQAVESFRDRLQISDPTREAESDQVIIQELEKTLIDLKSRRASLLSTVDTNSPSVRVLDRQIASYTAELDQKRRGIGAGESGDTGVTLSSKLTEYNGLVLEQEFAEKAYTSALASLETSQAEARRQDRYFAIAVEPNIPEIALYPLRFINTLIAFLGLCVAWLIGYLVVQAVRDHAV